MGQIYEVNDESIWQPSMGTSQLFLGAAAALEKVVGTSNGLRESMSDTFEIDPRALRQFVLKVSERVQGSTNLSLLSLIRPTLVHMLVLLRRTGQLDETVVRAIPEAWLADSCDLERHLAR